MKRAGAPAGRASAGLVLLHGRGAGAEDVLSLLDVLGLPDVAGLAPEAPGRSWWPTSFLAPSAEMEPHVARGIKAVRDAVAAFEAEGLARDRIWLAGFSQGACLALEAFAREGAGLAGAFGFSGALVGTADAEGGPQPGLYGHGPKRFDYPAASGKVWLSVHQRDPHIPLQRVEESAEALRRTGAEVGMQVYPGAGHAVMREDLAALRSALNR